MAVETLKIVLTADNKQALLAMRETVTSLDGVTVAGGKAGGATKKLGTDFTGMSRVLQDLPYGFNAIANNLTNILPAAGALGLGISALVAGLQFAQNGTGAWTRGLEGLFGTMTLADKVNQGYVKTLSEEKVALDTLFKSAQDSNNQMNVRLNAINQLREKYGEYLKGYSDEDILVGKATKAHELLLESLRKESIAKAAMALAAPIEQKRLELEIELINQRTKAIEDFKKAEGKSTAMGGVGGTGAYSTKAQEQQIVLNTFAQKRLALQKQIAEELKKINQLEEIAAKNATISTKEPPPPPGGKTKEVTIKDENKALEEQIQIYKRLQQAMMGQGFIAQERAKQKDLTNLKLTMDGNTAFNQIGLQQIAIKDELNTRTELANALTDRAMQSLTGLTNVMVNGGNIGEAFANMFKQLAADIALAAAKAAIFQGIMMGLNPKTAGSFGAGFLTGFKKLLGFSEGGTVTGPQSGYPVMLHGTEHIVRPDQMKSIIASASQMGGGGASKVIVEGRIQGQDIWLSQQRTNTFRGLTN
jgi:hypothetical protein